MEFRILGPIEVWSEGRQVRLPRGKQRALLAVLLLHRNEVVSIDRLIDDVWAEEAPATSVKTAQVHISQLRKLLGTGDRTDERLVTRSPGYLLRVDGDELDSARFERLLEEGRGLRGAGDPEGATETLLEALSLWRGPALADFALDGFAQTEIARLEEARVAAIEERIDADLELGRHQALVGELETLIRAHPLRERLRAQLMLALYRSDRQADALSAYQDARRNLDELGLEPSTSLRRLERAILAHDPELDPPASVARTDPERVPAPAHPGRHRPRRRRVVLAAALLAVAAVAIASVAAFNGEDATTPITAAENSLGIVDSTTNALVADVAVGATPTAIALGDGAYWVTNADGHTVSRIDPERRAVVQTIPVGSSPSGITTGKDDVWVVNSLDSTVTRVDAETNTAVQTIEVGNFPLGIAYANGAIWVANTADDTITKINADTGKPLRTFPISATELSAGAGALWASQRSDNRVARIDPATGKVVQTISVGGGPTGIDVGAGSVWVANSLDGTVSRVDPETSSVTATIPTGDGPAAVSAEKDGVWVSNQFDGTVVRIDPRANQVTRRINVGNRPQGVAVAGGSLLVGVRASDATHRGGTLAIRNDVGPDSIDPATAYSPFSWPYMQMTNDGLVAFNQVAGLGGTQLVPDLAVSLPAPTDGGRTYTFTLRQGIRYSNGRRVRASDVRSTFERAFRIGLQEQYFDGIVGAARCKPRKQCDLSRGIVTDNAAGTIAFHLVSPDPEFLYQLAIPHAYVLPEGTPARHPRTRPLPATGPYMITKYEPKRVLQLERNPYFHEWSKAAQPDGYPDTIILKVGGTADKALEDVLNGKAGLMSTQWSGIPSPALLAAIKTRYASQVHVNPAQQTAALFLNTRLAPFDRLDVRRAVSYAVDRAAAVRIQGGPILAEPTCQMLPPHYPGYHRYCPYTTRPTSAGTWTAPDLGRARELIAHSGTKGMKVTVWDYAPVKGFGRLLARVLDSLGYTASVKTLGDTYNETAFNPHTKAQIGFWGWGTDYPLASTWFSAPLTCASIEAALRPHHTAPNWNSAHYCDRRLDSMITKAQNEQLTNPDAARRLWERIDRYVVDRAPYVPLISWNVVDVLGKNVGNYQFSGRGMGLLIDQLWVR
jgi:YVTN family beta-propeller protein